MISPADSELVRQEIVGASVCRFCGRRLELSVVDLGMSPLCQTVVREADLDRTEFFYPLHVRACEQCWLLQIAEFVPPSEIFTEYAYFSSYSSSWVEHARRYVELIVARAGLGPGSFVVELGSNDGYLLQHFLPLDISVLGVEPSVNVAEAAVRRGVRTLVEFFGLELAERIVSEDGQAALVVGNNVLAQVPNLNDFAAGVKTLLAPGGTATFEVPHVEKLIERNEYDTIYHEHFSYFLVRTLADVFGAAGLALVDVQELSSHGGSIRAFFTHAETATAVSPTVEAVVAREEAAGLRGAAPYARFAEDVRESKRALLEMLGELRRAGKHVVGYGAPGKGNTLLNYCGIRTDYLDYTVDRNPYKQGTYTPGTRIPIRAPEEIAKTKPDVIVILPWNLAREISEQLSYTADWGASLVVPIPRPFSFAPGSIPVAAAEEEMQANETRR